MDRKVTSGKPGEKENASSHGKMSDKSGAAKTAQPGNKDKSSNPQVKISEGSSTTKTDKSSPQTKERLPNPQHSAENTTILTADGLKQNIKNCNTDPCDTNVTEVLGSIYKFFKTKNKLKPNETDELERLLKGIVKPIFYYLLKFTYDLRPAYLQELFIYRSAVRFLVDQFKFLPTDEKGDIVGEMAAFDTVKVMDETIARWRGNINLGTKIEFLSIDKLKIPEGVPETHTWWILK